MNSIDAMTEVVENIRVQMCRGSLIWTQAHLEAALEAERALIRTVKTNDVSG